MVVLLSEAGRVALVILLLGSATVAATWGYTVYNGPLADAPPAYVEEEGIFLVTYRNQVWEYETPAVAFATDGTVAFPSIGVPIRNVTTVEVILRVTMRGPSANDQFEVVVTDPLGEDVSGSHAVPLPSTEGYLRSDTVITWTRTQQPHAESHHVDDRETALNRSAGNHTDASAEGIWSGTVRLNQPLVGRSGNASLAFRMTHYEAVVLPQTRATEAPATPPTNTTGPAGAGNGTGDAPPPSAERDGQDDLSLHPRPEPRGPVPDARPAARTAPDSRPYPERSL